MQFKSQAKILNLLYVGRQFHWKNPYNIILAVCTMSKVRLTIIGDGPCYRKNISAAQGKCRNKIRFIKSVKNKNLIKYIKNADGIILNTYFHEWSKVMIETMLLKRPLIVNKESAAKVPELQSRLPLCFFCCDTVQGYIRTIEKLFSPSLCEKIAERARKRAWCLANPGIEETKQVMILKSLLSKRS